MLVRKLSYIIKNSGVRFKANINDIPNSGKR